MNLHPLLNIDKSFKRCYLKKNAFILQRSFFMSKNIFFYSAMILFAACAGCRTEPPVPEVTPLPEDHGKVRITLDVNISDTAEVPAQAAKKSAPEPAAPGKRVSAPRKKTAGKAPAPAKIQVPPPAGALDVELNSVEQQYVQQVRERNRQMRRKNQKDVFGSWMP